MPIEDFYSRSVIDPVVLTLRDLIRGLTSKPYDEKKDLAWFAILWSAEVHHSGEIMVIWSTRPKSVPCGSSWSGSWSSNFNHQIRYAKYQRSEYQNAIFGKEWRTLWSRLHYRQMLDNNFQISGPAFYRVNTEMLGSIKQPLTLPELKSRGSRDWRLLRNWDHWLVSYQEACQGGL